MNARHSRTVAACAVAAVLSLGAAGCGASPAGESNVTAAQDVTLHVLGYAFDKTPGIFDAFTEATGIKVTLEQVQSDQLPSVLQSRVSAKTDLDLINLRGGAEFNKYAEAGTFTNISDAGFLANVSAGAVENGKFDGKSYGYSISADTVGVFYNTELFDSLGIKVPTNWDEFMAANATIRDHADGVAPLVASAGESWSNQYYYHNAVATFAQENPQFMADLKSGDATWADNTLLLRQFERFQGLAESDSFLTGSQSLKYSDAQAAFAGGKAAMWVMGSWGLGGLTPAGFTPGAFALPINDAGEPPAVASSLSDKIVGVTSWSSHPEEALQLLEWMTSEEFGNALQEGQGVKSTVAGISAPYSEFQADWDGLFPDAIPFPANLAPTVNGEGPAVIGGILNGTLSPADAVARFDELQATDNKLGY